MTIRRIDLFSLLVVLLFTVFAPYSLLAQDPTDADKAAATAGYELFSVKCVACHALNSDLVGPALNGAVQRWEDAGDYKGLTGKQWMHRWIKNWTDPVKEGYPYAVELQNLKPSEMTSFVTLSDEQIDNIITYIGNPDWADTGEPEVTATTPAAGTGGGGGQYSKLFLYFLIGLLVVIALILTRVSTVLNRLVLEKEGKPVPEPVPFYKNKHLRALVTLVIVIWLGSQVVNGAIDLGRSQGYAPTQPIHYSHALHAGVLEIDCKYCHVGAADSKHAVIPSANMCMNCHKAIKQSDMKNGTKYSRGEIAKIYAAIGFNPFKGDYFENYQSIPYDTVAAIFTQWLEEDDQVTQGQKQIDAVLAQIQKPIEWVRIHNLPDYVYFNHSQHVTVAGVECQTCHGPVQEMEVMQQFAPLSMGWCLSCHRSTPINPERNDFYSTYKFHEKVTRAGNKVPITVNDIGGTECQKCHY